ncbi:MAG: hypothetical protein JNK82_04385 [Myxococcaceae bacterium]|nr:hypothetical protein [Myxococcaceae bacterium]
MALSRIDEVTPRDFRLEIPLGDFRELPQRLPSVDIQREGDVITVRAEQETCHLKFKVDGDVAVLDEIVIRSDVQGRFFQQVLGALLIEYQGDFRGTVSWSVPKGDRNEVVVDRGESPYPLLAVLAAARRSPLQEHAGAARQPPELTRAEKLQAEGRAAYEEYERLKSLRRN